MERLNEYVAELNDILLIRGSAPFRRWSRTALTKHGHLDPYQTEARLQNADVPAVVALLLRHWDELSKSDAVIFNQDLKNRLHGVRHARNRIAHFSEDEYPNFSDLLQDVALTRSFLTTIAANSALVGRADALIQAIVEEQSISRTIEAQVPEEVSPQSVTSPGNDLDEDRLHAIIDEALTNFMDRNAGQENRDDLLAEEAAESDTENSPADEPIDGASESKEGEPEDAQQVTDSADVPAETTARGAGEPPVCPECGIAMKIRTARKGRYAGSRFWGCPNFPKCKHMINDDSLNVNLDSSKTEQPDSRSSIILKPRTPMLSPVHPFAEHALFECLTVTQENLEISQDRATSEKPAPGAQWRLEYTSPTSRPSYSQSVMRALTVAEKILLRGRITILSSELETKLLDSNPSRFGESVVDPEYAFELDPRSPGERSFLKTFADWVGSGWHKWITPQADLASLCPGVVFESTQQRADFLLTHPSLDKPLIVEIDGEQYHGTEVDRVRDEAIKNSGYGVARIPSEEAINQEGPELEKLLELIAISPQHAADDELYMNELIRKAGQVQVALMHAFVVGLLDATRQEPFKISTDLVSDGALNVADFQTILDDLLDLLQRTGNLYGVQLVPGGLFTEEAAEYRLVFFDHNPKTADGTMYLLDLDLPFHLTMPTRSCAPGFPTTFDKPALDWFLNRIYRKPSLYDEQYTAIERALNGLDVVVLLPTGAGKSIAFQLAGFLLPGRTVVVAPIVSLIRDQAMVLETHGIDRVLPLTAADLRNRSEKSDAYDLVSSGDALFIYVVPQRFQIQEFRKALRGMTLSHPVSLIAIDEAHIVSEWGHAFMPAYLRIGRTAREVSARGKWAPPLMALTGTASRMVLRDLQRELQIPDYEALVTPISFDRPELSFMVSECDSDEKESQLLSFMGNLLPANFNQAANVFHDQRGADSFCGLIFCPWVNGDFGIATVMGVLKRAGLPTDMYGGDKKLPKGHFNDTHSWQKYKRRVERKFKRNETVRIACTKAFGMGIDKPNVRYTVHYGMPDSIESFYQEAGRAGRNREPAMCALLLSEFNSQRNAMLLSPENEIESVAKTMESIPRKENDDVTRALYFETLSFKGLEHEKYVARSVLQAIGDISSRRKIEVSFGSEQEDFERIFHRLTILSVIEDYTINYSASTANLVISGASRDEVVSAYMRYVRGYQVARANEERRKAEMLIADGSDYSSFAAGMLELYLGFVYDVIEKGRRRALNEMLKTARAGVSSPDTFRQRILNYLESTQFSATLETILDDENAGMKLVAAVIDDVLAPNEAAELRGQVGRYLETYPDQPALLYLRALSEALCSDCDEATATQNFGAWIKNALDNYGVSKDDVIAAAALALSRIPRNHAALSSWLEREIYTRWPERETARTIISDVGLDKLTHVPWILLDRVTEEAITYTVKEK